MRRTGISQLPAVSPPDPRLIAAYHQFMGRATGIAMAVGGLVLLGVRIARV